MDMTLFSTIGATLKSAQESINIALESRDLIKSASVLQQLSAAQQSVLTLQAQLFELQNKYFETTKELTKLKEAAIERERYALTEIAKGVFALKSKPVPSTMNIGDVSASEPEHFLCQPCLDIRGQKSILKRSANGFFGVALVCPSCKESFPTGENVPYTLPSTGR
jgi:uncharacterized protein YbaR (Trm112 family)